MLNFQHTLYLSHFFVLQKRIHSSIKIKNISISSKLDCTIILFLYRYYIDSYD